MKRELLRMRSIICAFLLLLTLSVPCLASSVTPAQALAERVKYRDEMQDQVRELPSLDRRVDELERRYEEIFKRRVFYPNGPRYSPRSGWLDAADSPSADEAREIELIDNEIYKLEQIVPHVEERRFQIHWLEDEIRIGR